MQGGDRLDNALSWASPELAGGLTLYAQYSFQTGSNRCPGLRSGYGGQQPPRRTWLQVPDAEGDLRGHCRQDHASCTRDGRELVGGQGFDACEPRRQLLVADNVRLYVMGQMFRDFYTVPGTPVYTPVSLIGSNNLADENARGVSGRALTAMFLASMQRSVSGAAI